MIIAREYQVSETRNPLSVGLAQVSFFGDQPDPAQPTARPSPTQPNQALSNHHYLSVDRQDGLILTSHL